MRRERRIAILILLVFVGVSGLGMAARAMVPALRSAPETVVSSEDYAR